MRPSSTFPIQLIRLFIINFNCQIFIDCGWYSPNPQKNFPRILSRVHISSQLLFPKPTPIPTPKSLPKKKREKQGRLQRKFGENDRKTISDTNQILFFYLPPPTKKKKKHQLTKKYYPTTIIDRDPCQTHVLTITEFKFSTLIH